MDEYEDHLLESAIAFIQDKQRNGHQTLGIPKELVDQNAKLLRSFSRPFGRGDCPAGGRALTKDEEAERIIINRSDRPTYPDQKSVLTS